MEPKRHIYKDCIILEYPDNSFLATALDADGDPVEKTCKSLESAQRWVDQIEEQNLKETIKYNEPYY